MVVFYLRKKKWTERMECENNKITLLGHITGIELQGHRFDPGSKDVFVACPAINLGLLSKNPSYLHMSIHAGCPLIHKSH